jgi:hypothetical protein
VRETRQTTLTKDFKVSLKKKNSASGKTEQDESAEKIKYWGHSSFGRATDLHSVGEGFESPWLHHKPPYHSWSSRNLHDPCIFAWETTIEKEKILSSRGNNDFLSAAEFLMEEWLSLA